MIVRLSGHPLVQDSLSCLRDHIVVKESMKYYFLLRGRELVNGLVLLYDDEGCIKMSDHMTIGGVDGIYVEYNG